MGGWEEHGATQPPIRPLPRPSFACRGGDKQTITLEALAACNGRDGTQIWVAYAGLVYDLTESFLWRGGRHWVLHNAGADLTTALAEAPHGAEFLEKFPVVGRLAG